VAQTIETWRDERPESPARAACDGRRGFEEGRGLELAPPPGPECECREALKRVLAARDRYLAALGDGTAPFQLPEEDEYLASLAAARTLFAGR
jgi:hypothetical protein